MKANLSIPATDIKALIHDGWVTLEGTVSFCYQKNAAENAIRGLLGVKGINNSIEIKSYIQVSDIQGKTQRTFERHADRENAEAAALSAPGVIQVQNFLLIR